MPQKVRKAVFPAAGLGTRFLPATKASPKEMLPLVDKPLIQYVVEEAVASGIESVIIVTGRGKTDIEDHFDVSFELEQVLRDRGKDQLLGVYEKYDAPVIGTMQVSGEAISRFGALAVEEIEDGVYKIKDMVEKPA